MAYSPLCQSAFSNEQIAIAVSHSSFNGGHTGIAFHSSKNGPQVLHLAWHQKITLESIPVELKACWIADPLPAPPSASKQVVAFVRAVATRLPKINYAVDFISSKGAFDSNGHYKPPKGSKGLTCASFVVELLRACRIDLIQEKSWVSDPANTVWANEVCEYLEKTDPAHASEVRKTVQGLRLIPFEVAGASSNGPKCWPVNFSDAQRFAVPVREQLTAICPVIPN